MGIGSIFSESPEAKRSFEQRGGFRQRTRLERRVDDAPGKDIHATTHGATVEIGFAILKF